jgi:hypothetical protein
MADQAADKLITPSDLRRTAAELVNQGQLPSLEELLAAIADTRKKYSQKIIDARHGLGSEVLAPTVDDTKA